MSEVKKLFNNLHSKKQFLPEFPSEEVIKWRWRRLSDNIKILILGSGGGRHIVYFAQQGFEVTGIDISEVGIEVTQEKLNKLKLKSTLLSGIEAKNLHCFQDKSFDAVLAFSVLYYQNIDEFILSLNEVSRVLKREGSFFFNMRTKDDWRFNCSTSIGTQRTMNSLDKRGEPLVEGGVPMLFLNLDEIEDIASRNFNFETGHYSSTFNDLKNDNYIIDAKKF
jgi:ubiquinone/menaquinone biosynthesis C-methylase UbiE